MIDSMSAEGTIQLPVEAIALVVALTVIIVMLMLIHLFFEEFREEREHGRGEKQ